MSAHDVETLLGVLMIGLGLVGLPFGLALGCRGEGSRDDA